MYICVVLGWLVRAGRWWGVVCIRVEVWWGVWCVGGGVGCGGVCVLGGAYMQDATVIF